MNTKNNFKTGIKNLEHELEHLSYETGYDFYLTLNDDIDENTEFLIVEIWCNELFDFLGTGLLDTCTIFKNGGHDFYCSGVIDWMEEQGLLN